MSVRLRPAGDADLAGIVEVFLACWRHSYAAVLPASLTTAMSDERAEQLWRGVLERALASVVVAEDDTGIAGLTRFEVTAEGVGYVASLYVSPRAQGTGLGGRLLDVATERMRRSGAVEATLWVFADNAPSIAFYARHGWAPDGSARTQPEFAQPEIRLARRLDIASPREAARADAI